MRWCILGCSEPSSHPGTNKHNEAAMYSTVRACISKRLLLCGMVPYAVRL